MKYLTIKNYRLARQFIVYEKYKICLNYLSCIKYHNMFIIFCFFQLSCLFSKFPVLQCWHSYRSKYVLSHFNLARLSLKQYISTTQILGVRKSGN